MSPTSAVEERRATAGRPSRESDDRCIGRGRVLVRALESSLGRWAETPPPDAATLAALGDGAGDGAGRPQRDGTPPRTDRLGRVDDACRLVRLVTDGRATIDSRHLPDTVVGDVGRLAGAVVDQWRDVVRAWSDPDDVPAESVLGRRAGIDRVRSGLMFAVPSDLPVGLDLADLVDTHLRLSDHAMALAASAVDDTTVHLDDAE